MSDRLDLGGVVVHRLLDIASMAFDPADLLPGIGPEDLDDTVPQVLPDGRLELCFGGYLVVTDDRVVLVDTGVGDHKARARPGWHQRNRGEFLAGLAAAGFSPEDVDTVVLTHLHADHVGWNTTRSADTWVPTFPKATYLVHEAELAWAAAGAARDPGFNYGSYADSVAPIAAAGLLQRLKAPGELAERVDIEPTPGHTPGSTIVVGRGDNATMAITGDLIHHPVQLRRPDLCSAFCVDTTASAATRARVLDRIADDSMILAPAHFPWGRLTWAEEGHNLTFVGL